MGSRLGLVASSPHHWLFVISLFILGPSLQDSAAVHGFTSRSVRFPPRERYTLEDRSFCSAADDDIGGISALPEEVHTKLETRHPCIAKQNPASFVRPAEEWFSHFLSLSKSESKRIYTCLPNDAIHRIGRHRLHEWLAFFLSDLDHDQLKKMVLSRPQLLTYKLSNIKSTATYFREELGLSSTEFASLLKAYPSALMYSIDNRLRPVVSFLQNECGGGKHNWLGWKRVIYRYPTIFSHSLEKTLLPKVTFLCDGDRRTSLGLNRSELSQVVGLFPPTLWLSEENLQAKIDFLSESLGLNELELRAIIVSYPQILGLSLENNLTPKINFFLGADIRDDNSSTSRMSGDINCVLSKDQLKEFVIYQPALLAYSLEKRIKPRMSKMKDNNIFFYYCPKNLMSYTDQKFDSWLSIQMDNWSISE
ncbi:hypothetical protein ACHAXR_008285 [Thalassiosira sp. AJA248-18]